MNARLAEKYLPDSSRGTGYNCPECEAPLFVDVKQKGISHCYKCEIDLMRCSVCGEFNDPRSGYTICRKCDTATCHDCGWGVYVAYDNSGSGGKASVWTARCGKCGREF